MRFMLERIDYLLHRLQGVRPLDWASARVTSLTALLQLLRAEQVSVLWYFSELPPVQMYTGVVSPLASVSDTEAVGTLSQDAKRHTAAAKRGKQNFFIMLFLSITQ